MDKCHIFSESLATLWAKLLCILVKWNKGNDAKQQNNCLLPAKKFKKHNDYCVVFLISFPIC